MIQVIIENPKTGKSYTCKSYSETTKDITYYHITYSCILRHKDHPFFKQFYHGPNGMQTGSERYKEIQELEKAVIGAPLYKLLGLTITETPLDGRTRYAKQLPLYIRTYWQNSPINHNHDTVFHLYLKVLPLTVVL